MLAKKTIKLEDLFTVRFSEKSASVDKTSDHVWVWGNQQGYPNNTIFIKRVVKRSEGKKLIESEELIPMAIVPCHESIDTDTYAENWIKLGYVKSKKEAAKSSLKKFVDREIKNDGVVYSINNGYIDKLATVQTLSNKLEQSGVSYESGKRYLASVLSPQSALLGKKFSNYYDLPNLEYQALEAAKDEVDKENDVIATVYEQKVLVILSQLNDIALQVIANELSVEVNNNRGLLITSIVEALHNSTFSDSASIIDYLNAKLAAQNKVTSTDVTSTSNSSSDITMLEAKTKNDLIEYAASLGIDLNKSMNKSDMIDAILSAIA